MIFFLFMYIIFTMGLFFICLFINFKTNWNLMKSTQFECGFDPFSISRLPFSLHFFKICLIFVFFDVEIILIFPLPLIFSLNIIFMYNFLFMMIFILMGLIFEWNQKSLNWV